MNLKSAKKIVSAYKVACSDGKPPTTNYDWQPSPVGYKIADLMLACRVVGTSLEELQKDALPKKEEPKKVETVAKKAPAKKAPVKKAVAKKAVAKKAPAKKSVEKSVEKKEETKKVVNKVEKKEETSTSSNLFKDLDGNGILDYKEKKSKKPTDK